MVIMVYIGWVVHGNYGIYWVGSSCFLWYILGGWFMVIMVYIGWVVRCNYGIYRVGCSW